jgi:hypothetical protein
MAACVACLAAMLGLGGCARESGSADRDASGDDATQRSTAAPDEPSGDTAEEAQVIDTFLAEQAGQRSGADAAKGVMFDYDPAADMAYPVPGGADLSRLFAQLGDRRATIVFYTWGQKPTGGHAVGIARIEREADRLTVHVTTSAPGPGDMVTQALTSPWHAVAIEPPEMTPANVTWRVDSARVGAATR